MSRFIGRTDTQTDTAFIYTHTGSQRDSLILQFSDFIFFWTTSAFIPPATGEEAWRC